MLLTLLSVALASPFGCPDDLDWTPGTNTELVEAITARLGEAMGPGAQTWTRQGQDWRPEPEPDPRLVPQRLDLVLDEAAPLRVTLRVERGRCVYADTRPGYEGVKATLELSLDGQVLERWSGDDLDLSWSTRFSGRQERTPGLTLKREGFFLELARERERLLAALAVGLVGWQSALVEVLLAAPPGSTQRERALELLVELDGVPPGPDGLRPGLDGQARATLRTRGGDLTAEEARRLGFAALQGDASLAGARLAPGPTWRVGGLEPTDGLAPLGGLVDLRWRAATAASHLPGQPLLDVGWVLATLGPCVEVGWAPGRPPLSMGPAPGALQARFQPGVTWRLQAPGVDGHPQPTDRVVALPAPSTLPLNIVAMRDDEMLAELPLAPGLPGLYEFTFAPDPARVELRFTGAGCP